MHRDDFFPCSLSGSSDNNLEKLEDSDSDELSFVALTASRANQIARGDI
jgi:hypothetical protein